MLQMQRCRHLPWRFSPSFSTQCSGGRPYGGRGDSSVVQLPRDKKARGRRTVDGVRGRHERLGRGLIWIVSIIMRETMAAIWDEPRERGVVCLDRGSPQSQIKRDKRDPWELSSLKREKRWVPNLSLTGHSSEALMRLCRGILGQSAMEGGRPSAGRCSKRVPTRSKEEISNTSTK